MTETRAFDASVVAGRRPFRSWPRRRSSWTSTWPLVLAFLAMTAVAPGFAAKTSASVESPTSPSPFQAEFRGGEHLANLAPRRRLTQQNEASGPVGRYVKLIVDNYLHFSEMIVYPPGNVDSNVAAGKTVTASGVGFGGTLTGLVDGDIRGATAASGGPCTACGYFHSATSNNNWVMVDFGEEIAIGGIFLYQTADLGGFNRALGLYVEILDASQNTVLTTAAVQESRAGYLLDFSTTYFNQWRGLDHVYEVGDTLDGWKHFVDGFTYDFNVNVENYASIGPAIYSVSLDGVLPITDQFTMHVPPDRGVCAGYVACTAGQIGFIDNDNLTNSNWHSASSITGTKLFSITSKTSISRIEITYARPIYAPGWLIQENGVEIFRENSNRGDSQDPEPVMYSYDRPCDTSAEPENGGVGDCPSSLPSGSSCQPTCDEGYIVSGVSSCSLGTLTTATCDPAPCDTSAEPENGGVGDCPSSLPSGSSCQPTCDEGYIVSGVSSCSLGTLTTATCRELTCCENTFVKFGFGVQHTYEEL